MREVTNTEAAGTATHTGSKPRVSGLLLCLKAAFTKEQFLLITPNFNHGARVPCLDPVGGLYLRCENLLIFRKEHLKISA